MGNSRQRLVLTKDRQDRDVLVTNAAFPTVSKSYPNLEALLAVVEHETAARGVYMPLEADGEDHRRISLGASLVGAAGNEEIFGVFASSFTWAGTLTEGVVVERYASVAWTIGLASVVGGPAGHLFAADAVVTSDGALEARTGRAIVGIHREPATVEIYDVGPVLGILRTFNTTGGTSISPHSRKWE